MPSRRKKGGLGGLFHSIGQGLKAIMQWLLRRDLSKNLNFDYVLFWLIAGLVVLGLLNIFAITARINPAVFERMNIENVSLFSLEGIKMAPNLFYAGDFLRHLISVLIGFTFSFLLYIIWKEKLITRTKAWAPVIFVCSLIALIYTYIYGKNINGATRWVSVAGYSFQTAEFCKLALVVFLAWAMGEKWNNKKSTGFWVGLVGTLMMVAVASLTKDLGATLIMMGVFFGIAMYAGLRKEIVFALVLLIGIVLVSSVIFSEHRMVRIMGWLSSLDSGFNINKQSDLTRDIITKVNWMGPGLGQSLRESYMAQSTSDFALVMIAEQMGRSVLLAIMILYVIFIFRLAQITYDSYKGVSAHNAIILLGILIWFAMQAFIHIVVNLAGPTKGLTLPFVSNGGSSMMMSMLAMVYVFRIDKMNRISAKIEAREREKEKMDDFA